MTGRDLPGGCPVSSTAYGEDEIAAELRNKGPQQLPVYRVKGGMLPPATQGRKDQNNLLYRPAGGKWREEEPRWLRRQQQQQQRQQHHHQQQIQQQQQQKQQQQRQQEQQQQQSISGGVHPAPVPMLGSGTASAYPSSPERLAAHTRPPVPHIPSVPFIPYGAPSDCLVPGEPLGTSAVNPCYSSVFKCQDIGASMQPTAPTAAAESFLVKQIASPHVREAGGLGPLAHALFRLPLGWPMGPPALTDGEAPAARCPPQVAVPGQWAVGSGTAVGPRIRSPCKPCGAARRFTRQNNGTTILTTRLRLPGGAASWPSKGGMSR